MEIKPLHRLSRETLEQWLFAIPFFKAVKQIDAQQFELLLDHSRVVMFQPGEVVLQRGDGDQSLYFLLKGRLSVFPGQLLEGEPVNQITPGEVFGDLARLTRQPRSASIVAAADCREVVVFSLDLGVFGPLESTRPVSLQTKLLYYRNTVHNLRWKLEVYRSMHPGDPLADRHRRVKLYMGPKDCLEELQALDSQARELAALLVAWNSRFGAMEYDGQTPASALNR